MRELDPSISPGHQLILFYRVNGECTEISLFCDPTRENGVYNVICKYKKNDFVNSTSNCKKLTKAPHS